MSKYPPEDIYELWWHGPYNFNSLRSESEEFLSTLKLYARYDDHPLYGRNVLTYIGKATKQPVTTRLDQHGVDLETVYVANVMRFESWEKSEEQARKPGWAVEDFVVDDPTISKIEELLILALAPAENIRNRQSAKLSWPFRLFNTGQIGSLPPEVSGHYTLQHAPRIDGVPTSRK